jgi:hypothetical protein
MLLVRRVRSNTRVQVVSAYTWFLCDLVLAIIMAGEFPPGACLLRAAPLLEAEILAVQGRIDDRFSSVQHLSRRRYHSCGLPRCITLMLTYGPRAIEVGLPFTLGSWWRFIRSCRALYLAFRLYDLDAQHMLAHGRGFFQTQPLGAAIVP